MLKLFLMLAIVVGSLQASAAPKCDSATVKQIANDQVGALIKEPLFKGLTSVNYFGLEGKNHLFVIRYLYSAKNRDGNYAPNKDGNYDMFEVFGIDAASCGTTYMAGDECAYIQDSKQLAADPNSPWHSDSAERRAIINACK